MARTKKTAREDPKPTPSASSGPWTLPAAADALAEIRRIYDELDQRIRVGYGPPGAREALARVRERAQALQTAYPTLWEQVCAEKRA